MIWHSAEIEKVFEELDTNREGLSKEEAQKKKDNQGDNRIKSGESVSPVRIFISQFQDALVYMLIAAALVSIGVGFLPGEEARVTEAALIVFILVLNGIFGFIQDYRAEKSIQALKKMSTPDVKVLRDGEKLEIDSGEVVPGDIIFLEAGSSVPADARLIEADGLDADESALTGESAEVDKKPETVEKDAPIAERTNMIFKNTNVINGSGKAVVVETGMDTEVGDIAEQLNQAEDRLTPFQKEVNHLGQRLGYIILGVIAVVTVFQFIFTSAAPLTIFLAALSLAVAANPVGLPAAVTLALAMGSRKMLDKNVLVRRLNVIESIGSVDVIITDKTGTLTEEKMTVRKLLFQSEEFNVSNKNSSPSFQRHGHETDPEHLEPLLRCGLECNNAEKAPEEADTEFYGDPTESALLVTARHGGMEDRSERKRELPFNSDRKRMTVITEDNQAFMKGAPEVVLERCSKILADGKVKEITEEHKQNIQDKNEEFSSNALRTLGFARKEVKDTEASKEEIESDMIFLGLQGMIDPPREEVPQAVQDCRNAGVQVVMATGDDETTAKAIGRQTGFNSSKSMSSKKFNELDKEKDQDKIIDTEIFARVTPEDKVDILKAHQEAGNNVAMTGNGVNDAPALKNADIGVAMGERGTDVAQQSSDMIVQDDNFASIRDAIEEGRGISDNIRKSVNYLLSGNMGEVMIVFFGLIIGGIFFPEVFRTHSEALILTPMMLLWINFISDGFPALALSTDPPKDKIMQEKERYGSKSLIDNTILKSIFYIGALMAIAGLPVFFLTLSKGLLVAQTALFTFIILAEMARIQVIRNRYGHSIVSNKWVITSLGVSLGLQFILLYTPVAEIFGTASLGANNWATLIIAATGFSLVTALFSRFNR